MAVGFKIHNIQFHVLNMKSRFPFKYGIASMTSLPHIFASINMETSEGFATGTTSEHLPPKWFTKNKATSFQEDLPDLIKVVTQAGKFASEIFSADSFFSFWTQLYRKQSFWAKEENIPLLLANLGTAIIEKAILDGICRAGGRAFHELLWTNDLAFDFASVSPSLDKLTIQNVIVEKPSSTLSVRHTIGLSDPIQTSDLSEEDKVEDGLPQSLEENIDAYGLKYFKIKVGADLEYDIDRLTRIGTLLKAKCGDDFHFTLDGNEQYSSLAEFREHWTEWNKVETVSDLLSQQLLFVEQPIHRDHALNDTVQEIIQDWSDAPRIIIDESDTDLFSLSKALRLGYSGTSHKNCKGITKGILNAAILKSKADSNLILSGEDLTNVGPLALQQDLLVMSCLGIEHVERNGHHYFKGLSMYPDHVQKMAIQSHLDLYKPGPDGRPTLDIQDGEISIETILNSPFGFRAFLNAELFTPLNDWSIDSLDL